MTTYAEILADLDAAIKDVLQNGQHLAINGRIYTKADLKTLMDTREKAKRLAASEKASIFDRRKIGVPNR